MAASRRRRRPHEPLAGGPVTGLPECHGHDHAVADRGRNRTATAVGVDIAELPPRQPSQGIAVGIGEDVGALVLWAESECAWLEPEIYPVDRESLRQYIWVLERRVGTGSMYAAVFPSLVGGRYALCSPEGLATQEVEIIGGKVTEEHWL